MIYIDSVKSLQTFFKLEEAYTRDWLFALTAAVLQYCCLLCCSQQRWEHPAADVPGAVYSFL